MFELDSQSYIPESIFVQLGLDETIRALDILKLIDFLVAFCWLSRQAKP